jgi:hypothetical protein
MVHTNSSRMRKRLMNEPSLTPADRPGEIDLGRHALFGYSSEDPEHPLEHLIDQHYGRGGTRWASARANATEQIVLEFDHPQSISRLIYEVEESSHERTQEVRMEVSTDRGRTYGQLLVQDYTFSPHGATFQHEELRLEPSTITHLR